MDDLNRITELPECDPELVDGCWRSRVDLTESLPRPRISLVTHGEQTRRPILAL